MVPLIKGGQTFGDEIPTKEWGGGVSGADHSPGKFHKYLNSEPNVTFLIRQTQYSTVPLMN